MLHVSLVITVSSQIDTTGSWWTRAEILVVGARAQIGHQLVGGVCQDDSAAASTDVTHHYQTL